MLRRFIGSIGLLVVAGLAQAGEAARVVFVAGQAKIAGSQLALDHAIQEGDEVATGADGYVYLKTIDNGFLILRPNSRARIVAYHIDRQHPSNTRVKLELLSGVARTISGEGVKQARENFRFNTPVAAIGVRGTDFTVFTDQETSRVAVISGGVVVSGFSGACGPEGSGPCEGATSRELFARQAGLLLQISKGQPAPQLLPSSSVSAPDITAPPRSDEPVGKGASAGSGASVAAVDVSLDPQKNASLKEGIETVAAAANQPPPTNVVELPSKITWGRWQAVLGQPVTVDVAQMTKDNAEQIAMWGAFALYRAKGSEWEVPNSGVLNFALGAGATYIADDTRGMTAANLENGHLQVDFGKKTFTTGVDVVPVASSERFKLQAQGDVARDGQFSVSQFFNQSNMAVRGVLTQEKGGTAAYLFQSRLDAFRTAYGATYWNSIKLTDK